MVQRFSTTTKSTSATAAENASGLGPSSWSMPSPGISRSTGPSPATDTMSKPMSANNSCQNRATIDTPSSNPSRNETIAPRAIPTR